MEREEIVLICERDVLDTAAHLFGPSKAHLGKLDDYEGCANEESILASRQKSHLPAQSHHPGAVNRFKSDNFVA